MKATISIFVLIASVSSFGQGFIHFGNTFVTQISIGYPPSTTMPVRTSFDTTFYFALFLAPSTTDINLGLNDPNWQTVTAYTTNSSSVPGRLVTRSFLPTSFSADTSVDILVRGWSASLGTTWEEAKEGIWGVGIEPGLYYGESVVGQNFLLGDGAIIPIQIAFGPSASQVDGFTLYGIPIPEPATSTIMIMGALMCHFWRKRVAIPHRLGSAQFENLAR